jgi:aspartate racemase
MTALLTKELIPDISADEQYLLGVLGGLGPLASAEFLKTVYEYSVTTGEQSSPAVIMYSDPAFPDRTDTLLSGSHELLLKRLIAALEFLCERNASEVIICCITIHHLLPQVPSRLRDKVLSLLDPIMECVGERRTRQLMLCTNGVRQLGVFERHAGWKRAAQYIVMPEADDQRRIHALIYEIKKNGDLHSIATAVEELLAKYNVDGFIAGCTEIHLLSKYFASSAESRQRYQCTDPLLIMAQRVADGRVKQLAGGTR